MVGILLNSCSRENSNESRICLEGLDDENELGRGRVRIVDGRHSTEADARSDSYKFRTGLDVNVEVTGNP